MVKFIERFKKDKNEGDDGGDWEDLQREEFAGEKKSAEAENNERQKRKIIAVLLYGDKKYIEAPDVTLNEGDEDKLLDEIGSGRIGAREERQLLTSIKDPISKHGAEKVYGGMSDDKHQRRILSYMVGGRFDEWDKTGAPTLEAFRQKFPTPMDFEITSETFLNDIKRSNPDEKYQEYLKDMEAFKKNVYGKRLEYWERIKELNSAAQQKKEMESITEPQGGNEKMEELIKGVGWYEASRAQVAEGMLTKAEGERLAKDEGSEDALFQMPEKGLFAVFDGAGGHNGGRAASRTAVKCLEELATQYEFSSDGNIAWAMNEVSMAIEDNESAGYSTGVIGKVLEVEGVKKLAYASVGDSRIYIVREGGTVIQVTRDEGEGRRITNALGLIAGKSSENRTQQFGTIDLWAGDRIVLCSDGITGDTGAELMSDSEMSAIVGLAWNVGQAAQELVEQARKKDDRTAIVVQV